MKIIFMITLTGLDDDNDIDIGDDIAEIRLS
jgi:hypothetical protein